MIIAELTIQTGTRPGTLANANIHNFRTMREKPMSKMRVMLILDHKRGLPGPGPVSMSEDMYKKMQAYVTYILSLARLEI